MDKRNQNDRNNLHSHHLSLPEHNTQDNVHTIYKLRLSMEKRLSPQSMETQLSPEGSKELKNMLERLVEIDTESRELLMKVFSMLEKDEKLENYYNKRVKDPKVSKMWELVEQVLACQQENTFPNLNIHASISDNSLYDKGIMDEDQVKEEFNLNRFKVRTLDTRGGGGGEVSKPDPGGVKGLEFAQK